MAGPRAQQVARSHATEGAEGGRGEWRRCNAPLVDRARKNHREPEGSLWSSKRNRSRSDLANLNVAAGEDERATPGLSLRVHEGGSSYRVHVGVHYVQIFAPELVYTNSGFAAVKHRIENPVAHGNLRTPPSLSDIGSALIVGGVAAFERLSSYRICV